MRLLVTVPDTAGPAVRHHLVEAPEGATVGELLVRLGREPPPGVDATAPLRHGYAAGDAAPAPPASPVRLVAAAGPDAGRSVVLPPGRTISVGRGAACDLRIADPALSRVHLRVRLGPAGVVVQDPGSTNGLRWADLSDQAVPDADAPSLAGSTVPWPSGASLLVGSSRLALVLEPSPPVSGVDRDGRCRVVPWPTPDQPPAPVSLPVPEPPLRRAVRAPSAWSWALPLVLSLGVAAVLRMPLLVLLGLMAPAMLLGHHLGERRAARLDHEAGLARWEDERRDREQEARRAAGRELALLRARHPGPQGLVEALVPVPTTRLWSGTGHPPEVVLGEAVSSSTVELGGVPLHHDTAPVVLDLSSSVAVAGDPVLRDALVRSLVLQLASTLPPSEVSLVVDPARPPGRAWDLLAWLPHTRPPDRVVGTPVVWDRPGGLLLLDDVRDAPPAVPTVALLGPSAAVLHRPGVLDLTFCPALLALAPARRLARTLAPLVDAGPGEGLPARPASLGGLVSWPTTGSGVRHLWRPGPAVLEAVLGTDDRGAPVAVDLARDGPHALVAGTTGSGKSELLRTLVTALALRNPPSRLALLLLDFKGGSSLGECARLPHATGLLTDLDAHLGERVLASLRAELRRRESLLAAAGARDAAELADGTLARLLVVVDEFRVLAEELPDVLDGLVRVATVGRSLGVHLVLATQRPAGAVTPDLRANVNLRIALRVRDRADSLDVLEVPDAASLPEDRPGLALLRTGADPPRRVQVAPAAPPSETVRAASWRVEEVPDVWAGRAALDAAPAEVSAGSTLGGLPDLLAQVAEEDGHRVRPVWVPPLPSTVHQDDGQGWALADRPEQQRREPVRWDGTGHLGLVGASRSGRSTAALSLVREVGPAWLYVVDPARGLEPGDLPGHPGLRAWVGGQDAAHLLRVLEVLGEVLDDRLRGSARGAGDGPSTPVVLLVDGWDRFLEAYGEVGHGRAREQVLRLLRDGPAARVSVVLTGDRGLLIGAVASALTQTWVLPLHDPADLALTGLRAHQVPRDPPPGRAVRTRDGLLAQVLLPRTGRPWPQPPPGPAPPRVRELPTSPAVPPGTLAVGGDDAAPLPCPDPPLLVLGPPGSGVSTALRIAARGLSRPVLAVSGGSPPGQERLAGALAAFGGVVVVDEAHLLAGTPQEDLLCAWAAAHDDRLVVGAELEAAGGLFRGLVPRAARHRRGLVLRPDGPAAGALLGVRVPSGDRPVPGRGVLVLRGRCTRVQVVRPDER